MRCLRFELQMVLFIIFSEHSLRACRLLFCQFVVVVLRQRFCLCNAAVCVLFVVFCFMLRKIIGNFSYLYNVNSYLYAASLSPLCLSLRLVSCPSLSCLSFGLSCWEIVIMPQNAARPLADFSLQLSRLRNRLQPQLRLVLPGVRVGRLLPVCLSQAPCLFVIYVTISVNRA